MLVCTCGWAVKVGAVKGSALPVSVNTHQISSNASHVQLKPAMKSPPSPPSEMRVELRVTSYLHPFGWHSDDGLDTLLSDLFC